MKNVVLLLALVPCAASAQVRPATQSETAVIAQAVQDWLQTNESVKLSDVRLAPDKVDGMLNACGQVETRDGLRLFHAMYIVKNDDGNPAAAVTVIDDKGSKAADAMCGLNGLQVAPPTLGPNTSLKPKPLRGSA